MPAGVSPAEVPARVVIENIGDMRFAELLAELGIRAQRAALPGVQDKTSTAMINLPVARAGERHILKLNQAEYPISSRTRRSFSTPPASPAWTFHRASWSPTPTASRDCW